MDTNKHTIGIINEERNFKEVMPISIELWMESTNKN